MTNEEKSLYCKTFGARVKYYREALNMSQKELGLAVGYVDKTNPSSSISKIERGEMEITQTKIADIAKALGISPSDLFPNSQSPAGEQYSETERQIIALYRNADSVTKRHVTKLLGEESAIMTAYNNADDVTKKHVRALLEIADRPKESTFDVYMQTPNTDLFVEGLKKPVICDMSKRHHVEDRKGVENVDK